MGKTLIVLGIIAVIVLIVLGVHYWLYLRTAHSTFEHYYAFRGCVQLLQKTDTYGTCRTGSGRVVTIVEYQGKWYLQGDLPWACLGKVCFGI
jgi:hypothetical protein